MMLRIRFSEESKKTLQNLHITIQREIKTALKKIANRELKGKALTAQLLGFSTLAVNNYRIIYTQNQEEIIVYLVGHRSNVYDKAENIKSAK